MKTRLFLSALVLILSSCGVANAESMDITSDVRATQDFYRLVVKTNANVILSQGEMTSLKVEGDRNSVRDLVTEVNNGSLIISGKSNRNVNIYVTVQDINMIEVDGAARVYANQVINSDFLLLKVNGSGSIRMDVRALSLGMIVKGDGKIIASGTAGDSFSRVFGNGKIYSGDLQAYKSTEAVYTKDMAYVKETKSKNSRRMTLKLHK